VILRLLKDDLAMAFSPIVEVEGTLTSWRPARLARTLREDENARDVVRD
jgi:hypothetical protein